MAAAGDVVLLAGKGHEKVQIIGKQCLPHDEIAIAKAILAPDEILPLAVS